jgi:hypothetical protein
MRVIAYFRGMTIPPLTYRRMSFGIPLLIMAVCALLCISLGASRGGDRLSTGITLDLVVTAPLSFFLLTRQKSASLYPVIRIFVAGLLLAGVFLYHRPHSLLTGLRIWILPFAEGALLFLIARKFYQSRRSLAAEGHTGMDFLSYSRTLLATTIGNDKVGHILASEMAVFYYVFSRQRKENGRSFTAYKKNGIRLILGVFLVCIFVEGTAFHFLARLWSSKLAWILTTLSAYTALQLLAHLRAIRSRPILLGDKDLYLRNGLVADSRLRLDDIEEMEMTRKSDPAEGAVKLALFKALEGHNIRLRLRQPVDVLLPFGLRRQAATILFFVDQPEDFLSAVRDRMKA